MQAMSFARPAIRALHCATAAGCTTRICRFAPVFFTTCKQCIAAHQAALQGHVASLEPDQAMIILLLLAADEQENKHTGMASIRLAASWHICMHLFDK